MQSLELTLQYTVVASEGQIACEVGEETIVLNVRDGVYYLLNPVASFVWKQIQQKRQLITIRDRLVQEYDVDPDACTSDLYALLSQLSSWQLIEINNGRQDHASPSNKPTRII